jgi:hypothetical protein
MPDSSQTEDKQAVSNSHLHRINNLLQLVIAKTELISLAADEQGAIQNCCEEIKSAVFRVSRLLYGLGREKQIKSPVPEDKCA